MEKRIPPVDADVEKWLETAGTFESSSMFDVVQKAYADFNGKDIGGFDVWFLGAIERCGYIAQVTASGSYTLSRIRQ